MNKNCIIHFPTSCINITPEKYLEVRDILRRTKKDFVQCEVLTMESSELFLTKEFKLPRDLTESEKVDLMQNCFDAWVSMIRVSNIIGGEYV